jgi:predicted AlkP superfamily phosphohydrolase/phosphomutase
MSARLIVIGLDAAEPSLIEAWAGAGELPHIRALMERSARFVLANSLRTLPGAIWPELATGISCGRVPHYYHPGQLHTGEAERRPIDAADIDPQTYYWARAARAGLKIASLDMPQTILVPGIEGVQLTEWGLHDRNFEVASAPGHFLIQVRQRYGDHPVRSCDTHGRTAEGYRALYDNLLRGAALKSDLLEDTLRAESWDLFTACFGETHCAGHQFWHFQDSAHPWHEPDAAPDFQSAILRIYKAVDAGVGRLVAAAGPEAEILLVASHGMGPYTGGPNLLSEILARMGLSGAARDSGIRKLARHLQRDQGGAAELARAVLRPLLGRTVLRRVQTEFGVLHAPFTNPALKAAALPNNRCGAIRLNLKGREPFGAVAPGNEAAALIEDIRQVLAALRDPRTGTPIVETTVTAAEAFGADHHSDVPDLMIVFRDDLGVIDACVSPRLGRIDAPVFKRFLPRSGDHTVRSRLWISGRGIREGGEGTGNVLDLAPTVLARLGVADLGGMDGRPLAGLAENRAGFS